ncbi:hypothetical protein JCM11641_001581 [Rhodosporidiobolus odoratus]
MAFDVGLERPDFDFDNLRRRRETALAAPLEAGDLLSLTSPTLLLDALSPGGKSDESPSPALYRPANLDLLNLVKTRSGWRSFSVRLVERLFGGQDRWAQVWVAEVEHKEHVVARVVLKLLVEALFWKPDAVMPWIPAEDSMAAELKAYAALRPVQGQDVAHCYGGFRFPMPWGEDAPGIILEDLSTTTTSSWKFLQGRRNELTIDAVDPFMCAAHDLLHRLQRLGIADFAIKALDLLVLNPPSLLQPSFVLVDFGLAVNAQDFKEAHERDIEENGAMGEPWQSHADYKLQCHLQAAGGDVVSEWVEFERRQCRGYFVDVGWYDANGEQDD